MGSPSKLAARRVILVFCVAFLPLAQALWVGVEYATDLEGGEPWTELRE